MSGIFQKTECERSPDNPKRLRLCISETVIMENADGSAKALIVSGKKLRIPSQPTLRRESTVRRENLSGESHQKVAIGKSFDLKKQIRRWRRRSGIILIYSRTHFSFIVKFFSHIEPRGQLTNVPREESFLISQDLHYWTKLLREEIYDAGGGLEKSQNIWGKNKFNCILIAGKDGILYFITTLRKNSFRWKDLKKALHLIFSEGESKHMLSRLAAQRICETKFFK